ncbi:VOC family protein [Microbacterium sp. RD1]|uniref:VOC family protein n=1 Tax=Microbacterium sp. RD1 TaxID=3457313 RepID=UPI003FA5F4C3
MSTLLHHAGFTVSDLDESIAFFGEHFGLVEVNRAVLDDDFTHRALEAPGATVTTVMLAGENTLVELVHYAGVEGRANSSRNYDIGAGHPCFQVDDLQAAYERMSAAGVVFTAPPSEPFPDGTRFTYFIGPDQIRMELLQGGTDLNVQALIQKGKEGSHE